MHRPEPGVQHRPLDIIRVIPLSGPLKEHSCELHHVVDAAALRAALGPGMVEPLILPEMLHVPDPSGRIHLRFDCSLKKCPRIPRISLRPLIPRQHLRPPKGPDKLRDRRICVHAVERVRILREVPVELRVVEGLRGLPVLFFPGETVQHVQRIVHPAVLGRKDPPMDLLVPAGHPRKDPLAKRLRGRERLLLSRIHIDIGQSRQHLMKCIPGHPGLPFGLPLLDVKPDLRVLRARRRGRR